MPRFRMLPPHGWKLPGKGEFHIPLSKHIDRPRRPAAQSGGGCAEQGRALLSPVEGRVAGAACEARGLGRARRRPARRVCVHHRSPSVVESGTSGHCAPTQGLPQRTATKAPGPLRRAVCQGRHGGNSLECTAESEGSSSHLPSLVQPERRATPSASAQASAAAKAHRVEGAAAAAQAGTLFQKGVPSQNHTQSAHPAPGQGYNETCDFPPQHRSQAGMGMTATSNGRGSVDW